MTIMEITEITQPGILSRTSLPEIIVRLRQLSRKTQPASMMSPELLPTLAARDNRQAQATVKENPTSFDDVAGATPDAKGKRCIDKVEMIEEIEYDDVVQCDHSYDKRW